MKHFTLTLTIAILASFALAQSDTLKYYDDLGDEIIWFEQPDVFAFSMSGGIPYNGTFDPAIISKIDFSGSYASIINQVYFSNGITDVQRDDAIAFLKNHPQFEAEKFVVTKYPNLANSEEKWYSVDNYVYAAFNDPNIALADVQAFADRNCLELDHIPSPTLPTASWSYGFKLKLDKVGCSFRDPLLAAKETWEQDFSLIKFVEPAIRLIRHSFNPMKDKAAATANFCPQVNDPFGAQMWHIDNDGTDVIWVDPNGNVNRFGAADADADICECWGAGYTGVGQKIAVIDAHGYEFDHEDMMGQFLDGFDVTDGTEITGTKILDASLGHGMWSASVIAATAHNNTGIAGVAYNAKIIPILIENTSHIAVAIQEAVDRDADIINMSLNYSTEVLAIKNALINSQTVGRVNRWDNSEVLGCVLVASAGNENSGTEREYPAAHDFVIGVSGSNPDDFRAEDGDTWGTWNATQGSNYGEFYEVVAPASLIRPADFMGANGISSGNYTNLNGTSLAAPVVSGIAALLLDKNDELHWEEVYDAIVNGAEQVNSSTYDYNYDSSDPGRSFEMQHGRVSCANALNEFTVGVSEMIEPSAQPFQVIQYGSESIAVMNNPDIPGTHTIMLFNMLGQSAVNPIAMANAKATNIAIRHLPHGIYVLHVIDAKGNTLATHKFVR